MSFFTIVSTDAFDEIQTDAGAILTAFDPYNPWKKPTNDEILMTTSGGVSPSCVPTYSDYAEDVDNVPNGAMEFKHLDYWTAQISTQSIKFNAANTKWSLGAADESTLSNGVKKIVPRKDLKQTDFQDIWWVGDKANGGAYAIKLKNALSTGGLNITTGKNSKGKNTITIGGHVSIKKQDEMPMEIYDIPPQDGSVYASVTYALTHVTSTEDDEGVEIGDAYTTTLAAVSPYVMKSVHILMGDTDITADVYNSGTGAVSIAAVTADLDIIAEAATQYSITKSLTHVTSSNPAVNAFENDAYATTLEPAESYEMDSVTVTMGGEDITDTVYDSNTGNVSIGHVTGAIVITAEATTE